MLKQLDRNKVETVSPSNLFSFYIGISTANKKVFKDICQTIVFGNYIRGI